MKGRRIPVPVDGAFPPLEQAGDYSGPMLGFTGSKPSVFFLKPNARDVGAPRCARSVQHVVSPPHVFTEESDGTLTIRESIGDTHANGESDGYHCFLTNGEWRKA